MIESTDEVTTAANVVFFERQEAQLCGQHCLNNLLQVEVFGPVDLAEIARQLDEDEQRIMFGTAETASSTAITFSESANVDNSGFFSLQVLQKALSTWNLSLVSITSKDNPSAVQARSEPLSANAFIINFRLHWYCLRRFSGAHWFMLNSLSQRAQWVSDTYLEVLLKQLESDGCDIFVVIGELPASPADRFFAFNDVPSEMKAQQAYLYDREADEDEEMTMALLASKLEADGDDAMLQRTIQESAAQHEQQAVSDAIAASIDGQSSDQDSRQPQQGSGQQEPQRSLEEIRAIRLKKFN